MNGQVVVTGIGGRLELELPGKGQGWVLVGMGLVLPGGGVLRPLCSAQHWASSSLRCSSLEPAGSLGIVWFSC
jgi:hypothetical protein